MTEQLSIGFPPATRVDTSQEAAVSMQQVAGQQALMVYRYLLRGPATCDEIEQALGLKHQSAAARLWQLEKSGDVVKTEDRRQTRSGRSARLYRAIPKEGR